MITHTQQKLNTNAAWKLSFSKMLAEENTHARYGRKACFSPVQPDKLFKNASSMWKYTAVILTKIGKETVRPQLKQLPKTKIHTPWIKWCFYTYAGYFIPRGN